MMMMMVMMMMMMMMMIMMMMIMMTIDILGAGRLSLEYGVFCLLSSFTSLSSLSCHDYHYRCRHH
jgi:hypothetical protein